MSCVDPGVFHLSTEAAAKGRGMPLDEGEGSMEIKAQI